GNGTDASSEMGPVITPASKERIRRIGTAAEEDGAAGGGAGRGAHRTRARRRPRRRAGPPPAEPGRGLRRRSGCGP
ncbi:hypothetical protein MRU69_06550, partial [Kocuria flava]|uniref:hypothetical protein n=1 Tax=Kocuria flava TaxID=446860 RepID=UPI001FF5048C